MAEPERDIDVLLAYLSGGAAALFAITVAFVVIIQTLAPLFGLQAGVPSETTIGILVGAVITLTTAAGARVVRALRRNGNGE
jgi:hypothetical protein